MGIFTHKYPYTDFHELNLDWILSKLREMENTLKDYLSHRTIKYADPIIWTITGQYQENTVVIDGNTGDAYLSTQIVPAGVLLSDTDYWTPIFNYSDNLNKLMEQIASREDGDFATDDRSVNDLVFVGGVLYRVTNPITIGSAYIPGSNIDDITIEEFISSYQSIPAGGSQYQALRKNSSTDYDVSWMDVHEVPDQGLAGQVLTKNSNTDYDYVWSDPPTPPAAESDFIRPEDFGAVGDGVTDDSDAFIDCFASNERMDKYILLSKSYNLTKVIPILSNTHIIGLENAKIINDIIMASPDPDYSYYPVFYLNNISDVTIDGISFESSTPVTDQSAINYTCNIKIEDSSNVRIQNCDFDRTMAAYDIYCDNDTGIWIERCTFNYYKYFGVALFTTRFAWVNDCNFTEVGLDYPNTYGVAISYSGNPWTTAEMSKDITVQGCNFSYNDTVANWESIDAHGGERIHILNNKIINCRVGIEISSETSRGFYSDYVEIIGNEVTAGNGNWASAYCIGFGGRFSTIANNVLTLGGRTTAANPATDQCGGLVLLDRILNCVITGNGFYSCRIHNISFRMNPAQPCKNVTVNDNIFDAVTAINGVKDSIFFDSGVTATEFVTFLNNAFIGGSSHIISTNNIASVSVAPWFQNNIYVANPTWDNYSKVIPDLVTKANAGNLSAGREGALCRISGSAAGDKLWRQYTGSSWVSF